MKKEKNSLIKNILKFFLLFKLIIELFAYISPKKTKIRKIKENFKKFEHEEMKEIHKFFSHRETFKRYLKDSSRIFKDYFIPYHGNGHKPKLLRTKSLAIISLFLIFSKLFMVSYLYFLYPNTGEMSPDIEKAIFEMVNVERVANDVGTLVTNPELARAARAKANDIIEKNYFSHYSPDGTKPWEWIDRGQYAYMFVGENLAMNFTSANSAHVALMKSPSHKKNILNSRYNEIGIAVVSGMFNGKNTNILVQLFATRKDVQLAVANEIVDEKYAGSTEVSKVEEKGTEQITTEAVKEAVIKKEDEEIVEEKVVQEKVAVKSEIKEQTIDNEHVISNSDKKIEKVKDITNEVVAENASSSMLLESEKMISNKPLYQVKQVGLVEANNDLEIADMVQIQKVENNALDKIVKVNHQVQKLRNIFVAILMLLIFSLIIKIVVRIEVQHKPVIAQTFLVILLVVSLIYFKFHYLEGSLPDILLI